jgi:hypothetical protein
MPIPLTHRNARGPALEPLVPTTTAPLDEHTLPCENVPPFRMPRYSGASPTHRTARGPTALPLCPTGTVPSALIPKA